MKKNNSNYNIKKSFRSLKLSSVLKKKLGLIFFSMSDKRLGMISINYITLSKDLRNAKIYIFFLNKLSIKETIYILNKSSTYLKNLLSKNSKLNFVPKLTFYYDKSIVVGNRINHLLKKDDR